MGLSPHRRVLVGPMWAEIRAGPAPHPLQLAQQLASRARLEWAVVLLVIVVAAATSCENVHKVMVCRNPR